MSRAPLVSCALLLAVACSDPSFVSLGRNTQEVASFGPAPGVDAGLTPSDVAPLSAACSSVPPTADDPATPGADVSFGCEVDIPYEPPPLCELLGERWPIDSACEQRRLLACPEGGADLQRLESQLFEIIARCTELEYQITVSFDAGCATAFTIDSLEPFVVPGVRECIAQRLAAERYDCAQTSRCAKASTYPRVTR